MAGQALGDFFKHQIAGFVAVGVIDGLEAIQINQRHTRAVASAPAERDSGAQAVGQQGAVRQAGEHVVVGQTLQFFLLRLDLRNIGKNANVVDNLASGVMH